jgi:hypothetical protein
MNEIKKTWKELFFHNFVIITFVALYLIVSLISTIHVIAFFELSNPHWLAVSLAIAFEVGAAASLSSLIVLHKVDKKLVWFLFILLTAMQAMGNTFYAFTHLENYIDWINLFGLNEMEPIAQKRILSIVSGAILPIVALGFIKSLVDYMKPDLESYETAYDKENKKEDKPTELLSQIIEKVEPSVNYEKIKNDSEKYRGWPTIEDSEDDIPELIIEEPIKEVEEVINEDSKDDISELIIEEPIKEVEEVIEKISDDEKKLEAKQDIEHTNFEIELDALKKELESEKRKTRFEIELDKIRDAVVSEKEKNKALKVKREKDELSKLKLKEEEDLREEKKKEKIKEDIDKELVNKKEKIVKEIIVKPTVRRNPNPTRPL